MTAIKVRENKLRRAAARQGYRLSKCRRYDRAAADFGLFALIDHTGKAVNSALAGGFVHSWTLDQVEKYLTNGKEKR